MEPERRARHLKSLLWGQPEGPGAYDELPEALRPVARRVDRIGDDLARLRMALFPDPDAQQAAVPQVRLIAEAVAQQVVPADLDDLPDPEAVWVRSDLEGGGFDDDALDAALHFYAQGGGPNVFRSDEAGKGRPALQDVRALQLVARTITRTARGGEDFGVTPTTLIEDFVRMHWSNDPDVRGLVGVEQAFGADDLGRDPWEEHPLGLACFEAVRRARSLPSEPAEYEPAPTEPSDGQEGDEWGSGWEPPASRPPRS